MNMQAKHTADITNAEESLAVQQAQSKFDSDDATALAMQNTLLTPRFYTTDFDEMDAIDVSPGPPGLGRADRRDGSRPEQGSLQEERGLGSRRLGRDGARR